MQTRIVSFLALVLLAFALSRCGEPIFSEKPFISFKGIRSVPAPDGSLDSLTISIFFRDGDGDVGMSSGDTVPLFDFYATGFKRKGLDDQGNPIFVPLELPSSELGFNSNIPVLKPDGKPGPIEGDLHFTAPIDFPLDLSNEDYILPGDTLKFEIYILDQSLNRSNTVETTEVVVLKR